MSLAERFVRGDGAGDGEPQTQMRSRLRHVQQANNGAARRRAPHRTKRLLSIIFTVGALLGWSFLAIARPTIEELKARAVLDDYESNVVFG